MSENKHTPGPWFATRPEHAHGWWIVSTDQDGDNCVDDSGDGGFEEANARLIAAAPDMLDALKILVNADYETVTQEGKPCIPLQRLYIAMAAIAKAEGRS